MHLESNGFVNTSFGTYYIINTYQNMPTWLKKPVLRWAIATSPTQREIRVQRARLPEQVGGGEGVVVVGTGGVAGASIARAAKQACGH